MVFNTFTFLVFFAAVFAVHFSLPHRWRSAFLLAASIVFYAWWDYRFVALLFLQAGIDYVAAWKIESASSPKGKKFWLVLSLTSNLAILGFFKYFNFFIGSVNEVFATSWSVMSIILPVGISFYTFKGMSYTIDVYRGNLKAMTSVVDYMFFISFFPELVAGPIIRGVDFLYQIQIVKKLDWDRISSGLRLMFLGLIKKVAVADVLGGKLVDPVFTHLGDYSGPSIAVAIFCFSLQIYADFSGYTDMAIGCARVLGFHFLPNFNFPYLSVRPTEFWKRWHISLSSWLRDYLYIPLGGNRKGPMRTYINLGLTMLLGGLWHGAAWNFVLWGLWQGLILIADRALSRTNRPAAHKAVAFLGSLAGWAVTFLLVQLGWLLFRVADMASLKLALQKLWAWDAGGRALIENTGTYRWVFVQIAIVLIIAEHAVGWIKERAPRIFSAAVRILEKCWPIQSLAYVVGVLYLLIFMRNEGNPFIYFQF